MAMKVPRKTCRMLSLLALAVSWTISLPVAAGPEPPQALVLHTRSRVKDPQNPAEFRIQYQAARWEAAKTAIIICDMWDKHWCAAATARVAEMAPRINELISAARRQGVLIIHAPSETMDYYRDTPQRKLAQQAPKGEFPVPLKGSCRLDPQREGPLPIDDSDGGCDSPGGKSHKAWSHQIDTLRIEPGDAISDNAEIFNLLKQRGIENIIIMGVHTNMCVLGRPFGIRQMVYQGKHVVLVRDLTDAMYNPDRPPRVSHFRGTEMVVEHIEKHWCPTITSSDFLGGAALRFAGDKRPHVVFLISEDEYHADESLSAFAQVLQDRFDYCCTVVLGHSKQDLNGIEALRTADVAVLFIRRRALPQQQIDVLRSYLDAGKPLVALRTASHAFSVRGKAPADLAQWLTFDQDVLGCRYESHASNALGSEVALAPEAAAHPILAGVQPSQWHSAGSLYKSTLLDPQAKLLATASAADLSAPVAWTRSCKGARVFYTSLGHADDFAQRQFQLLLINAIHWAMDRPVPKAATDAARNPAGP
jgi:nicotinamidase-related amidase/type 1 glutamine amidotransferase